jgi:hypothetical protein
MRQSGSSHFVVYVSFVVSDVFGIWNVRLVCEGDWLAYEVCDIVGD